MRGISLESAQLVEQCRTSGVAGQRGGAGVVDLCRQRVPGGGEGARTILGVLHLAQEFGSHLLGAGDAFGGLPVGDRQHKPDEQRADRDPHLLTDPRLS